VAIEKYTSESPTAYAPRPASAEGTPPPAERPVDESVAAGPSWPVLPVLAWLLAVGAVAGGVYVLFQSLGGGPQTAAAHAPEPEPPNVDQLMSVINGPKSARPDLPNPFVRPGDKRPAAAPAVVAPIEPIPGVSLDDWAGPAAVTDPSVTDEQAAAALTLQGHVSSGDKRCAINGRLYRQGDRVGRFVIGHIMEDGVVLHNGDFATLLRMKR
jgi:hypothetical protein